MEKSLIHGGARAKAGRRKINKYEKKIQVSSYHRLCDIRLIGGMNNARILAAAAIEREINKMKKT